MTTTNHIATAEAAGTAAALVNAAHAAGNAAVSDAIIGGFVAADDEDGIQYVYGAAFDAYLFAAK
jgi:hypothetical protein